MADWQDEKICRKCGYESEPNKYEFCPKCGTQLIKKTKNIEINMIYAEIMGLTDEYKKYGQLEKCEEILECYNKIIELYPTEE